MRLAAILFILIAVVIIYLGSSSLQSLISPYVSLNNLPFISTSQSPTPKPSPALTPDYTNHIVATGDFQFSSNKIAYTFIMPRAGGIITGSLEGVCSGSPSGIYDGKDSIKGEFTAKCTTGPLDLINVDLKIQYTGSVDINEGKIHIIWESTSPMTERGSFDLSFTPPTTNPSLSTSIKVLTPNGGESFKTGDTIKVSWSANNLNKNGSCIVTLQYNNGSTSKTWIPVNTPAGFYDWKVTADSAEHQAKVNLECYDDKQTRVTDQSDNYFSIQSE